MRYSTLGLRTSWKELFLITLTIKADVLGENPVPIPPYPLQIPQGLTWYSTQVSRVVAGD